MAEPRALIAILGELALLKRKLVLTQGDKYWRIEDLLKQARKDRRTGSAGELEALIYTVEDDIREKVSIYNVTSGSIIFSEVGAMDPAPPPY